MMKIDKINMHFLHSAVHRGFVVLFSVLLLYILDNNKMFHSIPRYVRLTKCLVYQQYRNYSRGRVQVQCDNQLNGGMKHIILCLNYKRQIGLI